MSSPAVLALSGEGPDAGGFAAALRAAVRRVTWRVVAVTLAVSLALDAWFVFEWPSRDPEPNPQLAADAYLSGATVSLLMAFCIMFATLVADEAVARGAKRLPAYACAVLAGTAAGALAQWGVHEWLHLRHYVGMDNFGLTATAQFAQVFFLYLVYGAIIVSVYANRRGALLAAARMHAAQVERAGAQRRTLESRLRALQARVEPQFLFDTLTQVRELYDQDAARGGRMLDDLIVYLRAALPQLRDQASTLTQELKLVEAYLKIVQAHRGANLRFAIHAEPMVRDARMQPMLLLPLIHRVVTDGFAPPAAGATLRIDARREGESLRVALSGAPRRLGADASADFLRDLRGRLEALHADRARLVFESSPTAGPRIVLEIPYETAESDPR